MTACVQKAAFRHGNYVHSAIASNAGYALPFPVLPQSLPDSPKFYPVFKLIGKRLLTHCKRLRKSRRNHQRTQIQPKITIFSVNRETRAETGSLWTASITTELSKLPPESIGFFRGFAVVAKRSNSAILALAVNPDVRSMAACYANAKSALLLP